MVDLCYNVRIFYKGLKMTATATQRRSLLGARIVLDEEKILCENIYDLEKMYDIIDGLACDCGLIKIDRHTYHCKGNEKDLACLGLFVFRDLIKCDWFTLNVKEWIWISEKEGDKDLIAKSKARNMGVWQ